MDFQSITKNFSALILILSVLLVSDVSFVFAQTTDLIDKNQLAEGAGANLASTLKGIITGQIGLFIGLAIVVLGLWTWIIKQETGAGITMIIGGVLITLAPGIFDGVQQFMSQVVGGFEGGGAGGARTFNTPGRGI